MNGDILLNLDSEDEGELLSAAQECIDSVAEFTYKRGRRTCRILLLQGASERIERRTLRWRYPFGTR